MSVTTTVSPDGNEITIRVKGNFDFTAYESLKQAAHFAISPGTRYIVDFQDADYLHDSGLGMLLKLRSFANVDDVSINIVNCRPDLKARLLDLKLHRYLNIH